MTIEEAIKILESGGWWDSIDPNASDADMEPFEEAIDKAIYALRAMQKSSTPCDLCVYNPPSSLDGKPCCMCPAEAKYKAEEEL